MHAIKIYLELLWQPNMLHMHKKGAGDRRSGHAKVGVKNEPKMMRPNSKCLWVYLGGTLQGYCVIFVGGHFWAKMATFMLKMATFVNTKYVNQYK